MSDSSVEFSRLVEIIARLRSPGGCPWDKEQTHLSLREFLIEEAYEVLEALDEEDAKKLRQELGDLLLQIMLHSQIAAEKGEFTLADVLAGINAKLVRRHPHVFGETHVRDAAEVSHNWEEIKKAERQPDASMLDSVPKQLPALSSAQEIQRRVSSVGFDWEDVEGIIEKLCEEVREIGAARTLAEKTDEFGDLLFTLTDVGRHMGIDPEIALRQANRKFYRRFAHMEKLCRDRGLELGKLSFAAQNALWEEAKEATAQEGQ